MITLSYKHCCTKVKKLDEISAKKCKLNNLLISKKTKMYFKVLYVYVIVSTNKLCFTNLNFGTGLNEYITLNEYVIIIYGHHCITWTIKPLYQLCVINMYICKSTSIQYEA